MDGRSLDGWLSKLASTRSRTPMWQRRWFVLSGDCLRYYNSPAESSGESKWSLELRAYAAAASAAASPAAPSPTAAHARPFPPTAAHDRRPQPHAHAAAGLLVSPYPLHSFHRHGASAGVWRDPTTGAASDPTRFELRAGGEAFELKESSL